MPARAVEGDGMGDSGGEGVGVTTIDGEDQYWGDANVPNEFRDGLIGAVDVDLAFQFANSKVAHS